MKKWKRLTRSNNITYVFLIKDKCKEENGKVAYNR